MQPEKERSARHPIRAVAKLTGIPIDTLRAWERRYRAVEPARDERGRLYCDADVRRLRLLRALVDRGHAIGRIAALPDDELGSLLGGAPGASVERAGAEPVGLDGVLGALEQYDGAGLDQALGRLAAILPARALVREVALPLMRRVGEACEAGRLSVAQEHIASAALRNLLGALARRELPNDPRAVLVFATPPGQRHEFGILAGAMLASAGGLGSVYLGTDLPAEDILRTARRASAKAVVLGFAAAKGAEEGLAAVEKVVRERPRGVEVWVGGTNVPGEVERIRATGATWLPDFDALEDRLRRLGARL